MMGSDGEEKTVVRWGIEKVAESVPTRFVGIMSCINRAFSKWCTQEISELRRFGEHLCRN